METVRIGDTIVIEFKAALDDGTVLNLVGATLAAALSAANGAPVPASSTVIRDAATGAWRATWSPAATAALTPGTCRYEGAVKTLPNGEVWTVGEGTFELKPRLTTIA